MRVEDQQPSDSTPRPMTPVMYSCSKTWMQPFVKETCGCWWGCKLLVGNLEENHLQHSNFTYNVNLYLLYMRDVPLSASATRGLAILCKQITATVSTEHSGSVHEDGPTVEQDRFYLCGMDLHCYWERILAEHCPGLMNVQSFTGCATRLMHSSSSQGPLSLHNYLEN